MQTGPSINKKLNLVIPLDRGDGRTLYVHSTPITRDIFEQYAMVMGRALSTIYRNGLSVNFGPRFAATTLKKEAELSNEWDTPGGVRDGLMMEIRRLANVAMPTDKGWTVIGLQDAIERNMLDADDIAEVEGQIVFFTLSSAIHLRRDVQGILEGAAGYLGWLLTLSDCTEFARSLPTSTVTESTGVTAKA